MFFSTSLNKIKINEDERKEKRAVKRAQTHPFLNIPAFGLRSF